jgi:5-methylcytosine-specific restriction protein A|tara:strand:+ start:1065 stop:1340 length:276 start_codon:yes stop_codon:yes gene_type:complete
LREKNEELKSIANQIKKTISNQEVNQKLYQIPDEEDDETHSVKEGKVIYKLHKLRERENKINQKKKTCIMNEMENLIVKFVDLTFMKLTEI